MSSAASYPDLHCFLRPVCPIFRINTVYVVCAYVLLVCCYFVNDLKYLYTGYYSNIFDSEMLEPVFVFERVSFCV